MTLSFASVPAVRPGILGVLAGCVLLAGLSACGRRENRPAPGSASAYADPSVEEIVIARIGDQKFRVHDLDVKTRVQYPQFKDLEGIDGVHQKWEVLIPMFNQGLWVYAGEKQGLDRDPEFLETLEQSRRYLLSNYAMRKLVYEKAKPTEEEARRHYEENLDQYRSAERAAADMILTSSREKAEEARRRAVAGEEFVRVVLRYSEDKSTRDTGGNVGAVGPSNVLRGFDQAYPELNRAIFATPAGGFTEVLETPRGWCFFRVREKKEASVTSFEEARGSIEKIMEGKRSHEIFANLLDEARRESRATIDTAGYQDYAFRTCTVEEVFQMTQNDPRAEFRISWFRAIARRDPTGPRAAQSLFLAAYGYAEDLRDYPRARALFEEMMQKHPDDELVPSARWMVENMEKGLENLPMADEIKVRAWER